ncbi:hypothetical protein [Edaphobacter flagellatus]|nr:hypothetical protein [Edaphobacter flagellatus]
MKYVKPQIAYTVAAGSAIMGSAAKQNPVVQDNDITQPNCTLPAYEADE